MDLASSAVFCQPICQSAGLTAGVVAHTRIVRLLLNLLVRKGTLSSATSYQQYVQSPRRAKVQTSMIQTER
jgi:hypothetical protein